MRLASGEFDHPVLGGGGEGETVVRQTRGVKQYANLFVGAVDGLDLEGGRAAVSGDDQSERDGA